MNEQHAQSDTCISDRQRLFDRLNIAVRNRVTIITAPDGYGKSTLLRTWAERTPHDTDFLSLKELNVVTFLNNLCKCCPADADSHADALSPDVDPLPILVDILNGLARHSDQWILILDDYEPSPELDNVLCFLIEYLPPYAHLIISGEEFPQISCLPRMRVRRELHEITAEDLLFEAEETRSLIERCGQIRPARDDVQRILAQTRGRAADIKRHVRRIFPADDPTTGPQRTATNHS